MSFTAAANRWSARLLGWFVKELPAELKPWGEAMLAELSVVDGVIAPLSWAMGGSMVLSKALVRRWFSGSSLREASGSGKDNHHPSRRQHMALVVLALCFAMLLSPVFRQALSTSLESWNPMWAQDKVAELDQLVQRAEQQNDAASLGFAALHTRDPQRAQALGSRAVALDPQLQWIWYMIIQTQLYWTNPALDPQGPLVQHEIGQLKSWDPSNSVPWLLDAECMLWTTHGPVARFASSLELQNGPDPQRFAQWRASMQRAFAAPKYDSYLERELKLDRDVLVKLGASRPMALVDRMYWHPVPAWVNTREYSNLLLREGDTALAGDRREIARDKYSQAASFAARMRTQSGTTYERFYALGPLLDAEKRLSILFDRSNQPEQKAKIDQQVAALQREKDSVHDARSFWVSVYGPVTASGIAVSACSIAAILALAVTLLGIGYFFIKSWTGLSAPERLDSILTSGNKWGPFLLLASCVGLYASYHPYAATFSNYMNGALQQGEQLRSFVALRYLPDLVLSLLGGAAGIRIWFWTAVTSVMCVGLGLFFWRRILRRPTAVPTA